MNYFKSLFAVFDPVVTLMKNGFHDATKKIFIGIIMLSGLMLLSFSVLLTKNTNVHLSHLGSMQTQQSQTLASELKIIQNEINGLQANIGDTSALKKGFADIDQHLTSMQQSITDMTIAFKQLQTIPNKTSTNNMVQLDAKALPFQVQTLDVIAETPLVTVALDHRQLPLTVGDSLSGWQLVQADYAQSTVMFQNNQHQQVKLNLAGGAP